MPRVEVVLDVDTSAAFAQAARRASTTKSGLLRHMVGLVTKQKPAEGCTSNGRRSGRLHIRVTPDITSSVDAVAKATGMTRAGVVAAILRAKFHDEPTLLQPEAAGIIRASYELGKLGTNLNQLVRLIHASKHQGDQVIQVPDQLLANTAAAVADVRQEVDALARAATARWQPQEDQP